MKDKNPKVRHFKCLCGKSRLLTVITKKGFTKDQLKEQGELIAAGCDMETISVEEARKKEFCFKCKL